MAVKSVLKNSDAGRSRSVAPDFTGWKVYKKSDNEEDIVILEKDAAGTKWFTETPMTARGHLFRGDYHIYFRNGEPLIALSTEDDRLEHAPKSAHVGCFCTPEEEDIAFRYIQEGHGIAGAEDYIADVQDLRTLRRDDCTWRDIIRIPCEPRCGIDEYDWPSWGDEINAKMRRIMSESCEERFAVGYYTPREIAETGVSTDEVVGLLNYDSFEFSFGWPKLEFVRGDVFVKKGVHVNLPQCESVGGYVDVGKNAILDLPQCQSVGEYVGVGDNGTLGLPRCQSVGGGVVVGKNAILDLPQCRSVGGDVYVRENATVDLSQCESVGGSVFVCENAILDFPQCQSVGGKVFVRDNATLALPKCQSVGGDVDVRENATLDLPQCKSKLDNIYVCDTAKYANIGGAVYGYESRNAVSKKEKRHVPKKVGRGI